MDKDLVKLKEEIYNYFVLELKQRMETIEQLKNDCATHMKFVTAIETGNRKYNVKVTELDIEDLTESIVLNLKSYISCTVMLLADFRMKEAIKVEDMQFFNQAMYSLMRDMERYNPEIIKESLTTYLNVLNAAGVTKQ